MESAIECVDLCRRFSGRSVVDGLNLSIKRGEVFGLIGHNGAGKTTTVRLLSGILDADAGHIKVLGLTPSTDGPALRAKIGVLTESPAVDPRLTGRENLEAYGRLFDMRKEEAATKATAMLDRFGLASRGDDRTNTYSKGMRQRLALARTLLHEPQILFLDEPIAGLDPVATHELNQYLDELVQAGITILLCTHNLFEAQRMCDRVAILQRGKKILEGPPGELTKQVPGLSRHRIRVASADVEPAVAAAAELGFQAAVDQGDLLLPGLDDDDVAALARRLVHDQVHIHAIIPQDASLEDVYLALHGAGEET